MNTYVNIDQSDRDLSTMTRRAFLAFALVAISIVAFLCGGCAPTTPAAAEAATTELRASLQRMDAPVADIKVQADRLEDLIEQERAEKIATFQKAQPR